MVELELLERDERPVALLDQLEPPCLELASLVERVARRRRVAQERPRDRDDGDEREQRAQRQAPRHTTAVAYRSARRRCSTASGHIATSEPKTKTKPQPNTRL